MKNSLIAFSLFLCSLSLAQPPVQRNPLTTNTPAAVVMSIVTNAASIVLAAQSGTALDWSGGSAEKWLHRIVTTDTAFTFTSQPTSSTNLKKLFLVLTNNGPNGVANVTFPSEVRWPKTGTAPNISQISNSVTRFEFEQIGNLVLGYDERVDTVLSPGSGIAFATNLNVITLSSTAGDGKMSLLGGTNSNFVSPSFGLNTNVVVIVSNSSATGPGVAHWFRTTNGVLAFPAYLSVNLTNGNVGLGTTTPTAKLEVAGTQDSYLFRVNTNVFEISNGVVRANAHYFFPTDNTYDIGASGATRPRTGYFGTGIDVASSVSLGVNNVRFQNGASASFLFNGVGAIKFPSDGVTTLFNDTQTSFNRLQGGGTTAAFPALGRSNGHWRVMSAGQSVGDATITTNGLIVDGFVGLGTTTPTARLDVVGNNNTNLLGIYDTWNDALVHSGLHMRITDTASSSSSKLLDVGTTAGGSMFSVSKSGNVGIGTATPSSSLDTTGRISGTVGGSTNKIRVGGTLTDFTADSANVTTSETDIYSYMIQTNTFVVDKDKIMFEAAGRFTGGTSTKQLKIYLSGTAIFDSGALGISSAADWHLRGFLIRSNATVVRASVTLNTSFATLSSYSQRTDVSGLTLTTTNIFRLTGTAAGAGAASSDIVANQGTIDWKPAGPQ